MQIPVAIPEILDATVTIRQWKEGDPFPDLGKEVAVDTETELITDSVLFPDLVVTGVFDPEHLTSWLIDYKSSIPFMRELCRRNIKQYYFNLGFDEGVLSKNDPEVRPLVEAIDSNRVIDMQIRMQLYQIATIGFKLSGTASLAGACRHYLKFHLDKGDGTENSARLSFHRGVTLTEEQIRYLPFDCIATWALSAKIPAQATEEDATKGMCVMAHTAANGFLVDRAVHAKYMKMLNDDKAVYARQLMDFGFPVRDFKEDMSTDALLQKLTEALDRLTHSQLSAKLPASKKLMRRMLVYMYNHDGEPSEAQTLRTTLNLLRGNEPADLSKQEQALYDEMVETFCLEAIDKSRKQAVIPILLTKVADKLAEQPDPDANGYDVTAAITDAVAEIQSDEYLLTNKKRKGPKEFFQGYVTDLLLSNCDKPREQVLKELEEWKASIPPAKFTKTMYAKELIRRSRLKLDTSPLSGDLKLTKYDLWKLEDLGISDKFLTAYTKYNHCDKYISTYLNEEFIKPDGRVHPRFENLVRTGRTSCSNPLTNAHRYLRYA